ncbi:CHAD domain-containing protein [Streptomyces sp. RB6PN25]|uniref:CHAD domain-containing protein n=1 Tax=Streptomyces humicola TaxID=2953240 RepID=A0ABT1Q747_9ACTN|nr:CHAD domain-containing protein [Streptomyces humicola]MCQ4084592.1 CHAD domain-containing protein [Streptomyces humicola]
MAQRHPDSPLAPTAPGAHLPSADRTGGEVLAAYLGAHAGEFLRALRLGEEDEASAVQLMRGSARRISAALHTYEPLVEAVWAERLRGELGWLNATLSREQQCAVHLARLRSALARLTSDEGGGQARSTMAVGAARAGALLERQLTLVRTRAHSSTLQAFGSSRFHAVADSVALLVSELPLTTAAAAPAPRVLTPLAEAAHRRLVEAAQALPLAVAARPYNGYALRTVLAESPADAGADEAQDAPWHRTRALVRLSRYALEVLDGAAPPPAGSPNAARLHGAARALDRHREAADAAAAVAGAARTPRITPATAYALGVLHTDQRSEVEAARYAFSHMWQGMVPAPAPATAP